MPKMTSKIALEYATRIEALNEQISGVYREVCDRYGASEINLIRDVVKAREEAADAQLVAEGLIAAIDAEGEDV